MDTTKVRIATSAIELMGIDSPRAQGWTSTAVLVGGRTKIVVSGTPLVPVCGGNTETADNRMRSPLPGPANYVTNGDANCSRSEKIVIDAYINGLNC